MSTLSAGMTLASGALLLLLASMVSIAAGVAGGALIGPKDNKTGSALLGGALTAIATLPGLAIGFAVGLWR